MTVNMERKADSSWWLKQLILNSRQLLDYWHRKNNKRWEENARSLEKPLVRLVCNPSETNMGSENIPKPLLGEKVLNCNVFVS